MSENKRKKTHNENTIILYEEDFLYLFINYVEVYFDGTVELEMLI